MDGGATITLVDRFQNATRDVEGGLRWDLARIEARLDEGLRRCAEVASEGIRAIAVDGWAVDYVRMGADDRAMADPFCYRDERTVRCERLLYEEIASERLRELTGVQLLRINTLYQLYADALHFIWVRRREFLPSPVGR